VCLPRHLNEVQQWRYATVGWVSSRRRQPVKSVNCNRRMVGKGLRTGIQILRMVSFTETMQRHVWKSPFNRHYKERSPALGGGKCQSILPILSRLIRCDYDMIPKMPLRGRRLTDRQGGIY